MRLEASTVNIDSEESKIDCNELNEDDNYHYIKRQKAV